MRVLWVLPFDIEPYCHVIVEAEYMRLEADDAIWSAIAVGHWELVQGSNSNSKDV